MAAKTPLQKMLAELFEAQPDDLRLRDHLEGFKHNKHFPGHTWFWGPILYARNKAVFRTLIMTYFSDTDWKWNQIKWASHADRLEPWLEAAREGRDSPLVRRLLQWKYRSSSWGVDQKAWKNAMMAAYRDAPSAAARAIVLDEFETRFELDEPMALELYGIDRNSGPFLLQHLSFSFWSGSQRSKLWKQLAERFQAAGDEELYFQLYRKQMPLKEWQAEVLALAERISNADELNQELQRRHPEGWGLTLSDTGIKLLKSRGRDVLPYVAANLESFVEGWFSDRANQFVKLAEEKEWWDLWSTVIRKGWSPDRFNQAIKKLLSDDRISEADLLERLRTLAGVSAEWNWGGFGFARIHTLKDDLAERLYRRYPDLIHGPFKPNVTPVWWQGFPKLLAAAQAAEDDELVDLLASRYATQVRYENMYYAAKERNQIVDTADQLGAYYQELRDRDPDTFTRRAANVLTRMPGHSVFSYGQLLKTNQLARLLFVRSFPAYLAVPEAVRDLVEGSSIYVQMLGYRVLAQDDPRAEKLAVETIDILLGTLLRPLHRKTRIAAFGALRSAAKADAEVAQRVLDRAREALRLPDKRYPKEELIGLIGQILSLRPELRSEAERPVIYGLEEALS
ncbi:hypothetical protein GC197_08455 [bacterium]|nr:hypothetical protein [bacterium]